MTISPWTAAPRIREALRSSHSPGSPTSVTAFSSLRPPDQTSLIARSALVVVTRSRSIILDIDSWLKPLQHGRRQQVPVLKEIEMTWLMEFFGLS